MVAGIPLLLTLLLVPPTQASYFSDIRERTKPSGRKHEPADVNGVLPTANSRSAKDSKNQPSKKNRRNHGAGGSGSGLSRRMSQGIGPIVPICSCESVSDDDLQYSDIRQLSDEFSANGVEQSNTGASNMVWAFGQFLDHDLVSSLDDHNGRSFPMEISHGGQSAAMQLTRVLKTGADGTCKMPVNTQTPQIDAGTVYSPDEEYLQSTLREPGSCKLRTVQDGLLPLSEPEEASGGKVFMLAGDLRVNEHAVLTSMHTIWVREHNRLCDILEDRRHKKRKRFNTMSPDEKFQLIRKVVVAKMQQITIKEFLPKIGIPKRRLHHATTPRLDTADISLEFATAAFRFGHDLVPDHIGKFATSDLFDGESFFLESGDKGVRYKHNAKRHMDRILHAVATTPANKADGKVSDALRNLLFGSFGEDLVARNIFRSREVGMASYPELLQCFGSKPRGKKIYDPENVPDAFIGLMTERRRHHNMLGKTTELVIAEQIHRSLFGNGGYYWKTDKEELKGWLWEIRSTTLANVINANSGAQVPANVFSV